MYNGYIPFVPDFKSIDLDNIQCFSCQLVLQEKHFRKQSFDGQNKTFGLIDVYALPNEEYIGSFPLWWDEKILMNLKEHGFPKPENIFKITVIPHAPLPHIWTYEDYRKGLCGVEDIDKQEFNASGELVLHDKITFLVRPIIDNELNEWLNIMDDIKREYQYVCRWCYTTVEEKSKRCW